MYTIHEITGLGIYHLWEIQKEGVHIATVISSSDAQRIIDLLNTLPLA